MMSITKVVEEKLNEEISTFYHLDMDDLEAFRERRLLQMKKMAKKSQPSIINCQEGPQRLVLHILEVRQGLGVQDPK